MASFSSGARLGFLLASPLMGLIAERTSVAVALRRGRRRRRGHGRRDPTPPCSPSASSSPIRCDTPPVRRLTDVPLTPPTPRGRIRVHVLRCPPHPTCRRRPDRRRSRCARHHPHRHPRPTDGRDGRPRARRRPPRPHIVVVDGTDEPDSVLDVVEHLAEVDRRLRCRRQPSSSPRCGREAPRSTPTTSAGWRPATWPTTPGWSWSSGSYSTGEAALVEPARPSRGAAAMVTRQPVLARRWAGLTRRPAPRRRRSSSLLPTSTAPAATMTGRCSSGTS